MKKILYIAVALFSANAMAQRVGVNTETPQAALEVNGNVSLETVPEAGQQEQTYNLLIDKNTRRLVIASGEKRLFNNITYKIFTNNQDWIYDANTNVPTNQYTAILVSSYFGNKYYDDNVAYSAVRYGIKHSYRGGNITETVSVEPGDDGYWHIKADYDGANPFVGGPGRSEWPGGDKDLALGGKDSFYWKFDVLYVDSGSLIDLGEAEGTVAADTEQGQWDQGTGYSNPIEYLKAKK